MAQIKELTAEEIARRASLSRMAAGEPFLTLPIGPDVYRITDRDIEYFMVCRLLDEGKLEDCKKTLELMNRETPNAVIVILLWYIQFEYENLKDLNERRLAQVLQRSQNRVVPDQLHSIYLSTVQIVGADGRHSPSGYTLRGLIACYIEHNFQRANALYSQAIQSATPGSPAYVVSLLEQAYLYLTARNVTEERVRMACENFSKLTERCPDAYYYLAACEYRLGRTQEHQQKGYKYLQEALKGGSPICQHYMQEISPRRKPGVPEYVLPTPFMPELPPMICCGFISMLAPTDGVDTRVEVAIDDEARLRKLRRPLDEFINDINKRLAIEAEKKAKEGEAKGPLPLEQTVPKPEVKLAEGGAEKKEEKDKSEVKK